MFGRVLSRSLEYIIGSSGNEKYSLREKCPYSEFFWSAFSRIRTEYREISSISPYSVQMRENTDRKNPEYGHFSRSDRCSITLCLICFINLITSQKQRGLSILFRRSHRRRSVRKGVLRNFAKFTGKRLCQSLFFNTVAGIHSSTK